MVPPSTLLEAGIRLALASLGEVAGPSRRDRELASWSAEGRVLTVAWRPLPDTGAAP